MGRVIRRTRSRHPATLLYEDKMHSLRLSYRGSGLMKGNRMLGGKSDGQSNWRDCLHGRDGILAVLLARVSQGRSPKPRIIRFRSPHRAHLSRRNWP
jgi:hypothetical protein